MKASSLRNGDVFLYLTSRVYIIRYIKGGDMVFAAGLCRFAARACLACVVYGAITLADFSAKTQNFHRNVAKTCAMSGNGCNFAHGNQK